MTTLLRLLFVCCHPALPKDAQAALALKVLCGFSTAEIAAAFLRHRGGDGEAADADEAERFATWAWGLSFRGRRTRMKRLDGVLATLYLAFQ